MATKGETLSCILSKGPIRRVAIKLIPKPNTPPSRQRDKLIFTVANSHTCIAPDKFEKLFDRFYRLDEARTKTEEGYGLGLSIAKEIARQHGAALRASSSKEQGTCFTLLIQMMD